MVARRKIPQFTNQAGQPIEETRLFQMYWSERESEADVQQAIALILGHLQLKIVRTNATKHGNTEMRLLPDPD